MLTWDDKRTNKQTASTEAAHKSALYRDFFSFSIFFAFPSFQDDKSNQQLDLQQQKQQQQQQQQIPEKKKWIHDPSSEYSHLFVAGPKRQNTKQN